MGEREPVSWGCGLRSGVEEASIDLDKLIDTSLTLMEGPQFPLATHNDSLFSKQELSSSPWGLFSKCLALGEGHFGGNRHSSMEYCSFLYGLVYLNN